MFVLDGRRYALPLDTVERVLAAAAPTPLPAAPAIVLGALDLAGQVVPVVDIRRRFGLPEREIEPADRMIVAHAGTRTLAVLADEVAGVVDAPEPVVTIGSELLPGVGYVRGIARLADGLVVIHDLATFLSLDEARALDEAMTPRGGRT